MDERIKYGARVHMDTGYVDTSWSGVVALVDCKRVVVHVFCRSLNVWQRLDYPRAYAEAVLLFGPLPKRKRKKGNGVSK